MQHQVITEGPASFGPELRVVAATSTRQPFGPRPEGEDRRARSRYLLVSHPDGRLALVDGGIGPALIPSRGRGLNTARLLTPWDLLAAIEVSPIHLCAVLLTGPDAELASNLGRLPMGIPVYHHAGTARTARRNRRLIETHLGRAAESLMPLDHLPRSTWEEIEGHDLFGDGSCLAVPLTDRDSGHIGLLMPRVERMADPVLYLTRTDLRFTAEDGSEALSRLPQTVRHLMRRGCRVLHGADPDPTDLDVIEV